jgi:16S rRNA (guanine(966)-N(2))-methyltransferase RsmD
LRIISGLKRGLKLSAPPGLDTRPVLDRVKQSWFDVLGARIEDARALDVFSGVGSLGLEALSRGARSCTFIESAKECVEMLREHLDRTGFTARADVLGMRAAAALDTLRGRGAAFDCIFLDPPFALAAGGAFYEDDGLLARVAALCARGGLVMLRREGPQRKKRDPFPPLALPEGLTSCDRRQWGRNEVVFIERGAVKAGDGGAP